ncbi:hypothetical protein Tsubulata_024905, partial [Turnera subulata]
QIAARDRAQGRIPAVFFTQSLLEKNPTSRPLSRKHLLITELQQIQAILKSVKPPYFCSTTFPLQIRAGSGSSFLLESGNVLPIKADRDEETGKILNLVFVWADEGSELKVGVPVVFNGEEEFVGFYIHFCFGILVQAHSKMAQELVDGHVVGHVGHVILRKVTSTSVGLGLLWEFPAAASWVTVTRPSIFLLGSQRAKRAPSTCLKMTEP